MGSFIAGSYSVTWNTAALGQLEAGATIEHRDFKRIITGDNYADTPQDAIHRGNEVFAQMTLIEYAAAGIAAAISPGSTAYLDFDRIIGTLDVGSGTANAKVLVLTALAGTPAAAVPASITFSAAILAEGFPVSILFAPDLRTVPIRFRCYPDSNHKYAALA